MSKWRSGAKSGDDFVGVGECQMKVFLSAVIVGTSICTGSGIAQVYPSQPIAMFVPSAAGGPTDTLARILAESMSAVLGQPFVLENNGAAGGSLAVGRVARAQPDGYSVGIGTYGNYVLNGAIYPLQYDLLEDFEPVALLVGNPQIIVARKDMPAKNMSELIAWLKANPGKATQGTAGAGSPAHVSGIFFQNITGTAFQFVPYRGAAPAMNDLVAGQIDLLVDQASNALSQVRSGSVRAYAVTAKARVAAATHKVPITMYSTAWDPGCRRARTWLVAHGYTYTERDVEADPAASRARAALTSDRGVPVIDVDGQVLTGFDEARLARALEYAAARGLER